LFSIELKLAIQVHHGLVLCRRHGPSATLCDLALKQCLSLCCVAAFAAATAASTTAAATTAAPTTTNTTAATAASTTATGSATSSATATRAATVSTTATSSTTGLARDACDGSRGRCGTFSSRDLASALLGQDNASLFLLGASNLEDLLVGAPLHLLD
jgi:cobalamin biosynthesis Mg chelatase CobN